MEWTYLINPFIIVAKESRPRAEKVADYTYDALLARQLDAFFGPLYLTYKPIYLAMKAEQATWGVQKGTQKAGTLTLDELLAQLSPVKINLWDRQIGNVFSPGSSQYTALLPNGHAPFGGGSKDGKIEAVKELGQALTGIVALAATKTDVDAFYTLLNNARTAQLGLISDTKDDSTGLSAAMQNCMVALYSVLGTCIGHFAATPDSIKAIFDIETIRDAVQKTFVDTIPQGIGNVINIAKRTLPPTKQIRITVMSDKDLDFAITDGKHDAVGTHKVTVAGLSTQTFTASQLQVSAISSFLKGRNTDGTEAGHFKVELL